MKPLPTCQQVLTWVCLCPADASTSTKKRLCYAGLTLFAGVIELVGLLASIGFFLKFVSVDLEVSLYAIFQVGAYAAMLNLIIIGLINRHRIAAIFTELSKLYTASMDRETETSFQFLAEANGKSEWLWKIYFLFAIKGFLVNVFVSTVASITYCFHKYGVFDVDQLFKPYKVLFPWNQHTLFGYLWDLFGIGVCTGEVYLLINGAVLILFVSMCWHHRAFYQKFRYAALELDRPENKQNVNEIFCELIRSHISAKDWFTQSAEAYSPFVLVQLICNVIFMAAVVFELDLRLRHIAFDFDTFLLLNATPLGVSNLFAYCYFGKLATESYEKMAERVYKSNWHELSPNLQKKVLLMIQNMQKPVYYHGFGVAILNLETFVKVVRAIYSYYMIFKTLTTE